MNLVLKMSWDIANQSTAKSGNEAKTVDNKTRLQALALVNDYYKYIIDLAYFQVM
jgi:hypothetical protein